MLNNSSYIEVKVQEIYWAYDNTKYNIVNMISML